MQFRLSASIITLLTFALPAFAQYSSPESAVYDSVGNRWIVSNAGRGTIVERSAAGEVREFATNLAGPKGLCIVGDTLYVADETRIRGYRLSTRAALFNIAVDGSSFLNDAAADDDFLYISEMVRHRIYRMNLESHQVEAWVTNGVASPNGLYFDGEHNRLIVVSMRDNSPIQQIDISDASVSTIVNTDLDDLDGITRDGNGNYYISSWGSNAIYRFAADFSNQERLETGYDGPADIFYDRVNNILAIPCMNVHRVVFRETPPPQAELRTPFLIDFQDVYIHTSLAHTIEWRNSGGEELVLDSVSHSGEGFNVELPDNQRIEPAGSEEVVITFQPIDSVQYVDTISIYSSEPMSPRQMVLLGRGVAAPRVEVEGTHDFGRGWIGCPLEWELTISNAGLSPLILDSMVTHTQAFRATLPDQREIPPNGSGNAVLTFQPEMRGGFEDTLWIYSNDPVSPASVVLTGVGIVAPSLRLPQRLDFGLVDVGQTEQMDLAWTNIGDENVVIDSVVLSGGDDIFRVQLPDPRSIAPEETVESTVTFSPPAVGEYAYMALIYSNDPSAPGRLTLRGYGNDPNSIGTEAPPTEFSISEGFPSPFNSRVSFQLSLPGAAQVKISMFDVEGRRIRQIADDRYQAGIHQIGIDGTGLADGVYFLRGSAGPNQFDRKILLLK